MDINVTKLDDRIELKLKLIDCALNSSFTIYTDMFSESAATFAVEMLKTEYKDILEKYLFMPANNTIEMEMRHELECKLWEYLYWADNERQKYNLSLSAEGYFSYKHNKEIEESLNVLDGDMNPNKILINSLL